MLNFPVLSVTLILLAHFFNTVMLLNFSIDKKKCGEKSVQWKILSASRYDLLEHFIYCLEVMANLLVMH